MSIFKELTISWNDTEYKLQPSMRLLNRIEERVSLAVISARIASGQPPLSMLATAYAVMLESAGCKVTEEQVYEALFSLDASGISAMSFAVMTLANPVAQLSAEKKTG